MIRESINFMLRGPAHSIGVLALLAFIPIANMLVTPLAMLIVISRGAVLGLIALLVAVAVEATAAQAYFAYVGNVVPEPQLPIAETIIRYLAPMLMAVLVRYYRRIDWAMQGAWVALLLVVAGVLLFSEMPTAAALADYANCLYGCAEGATSMLIPQPIQGYWSDMVTVVINGWAGLIFFGSAFCLYLACWLEKITERTLTLKDGLFAWRLPLTVAILAMLLGFTTGFGTLLPLWLVAAGWLSAALLGCAGLVLLVAICQQYQKTWLWLTMVVVALLIGVLPTLLVCAVLAVLDSLFDFRGRLASVN